MQPGKPPRHSLGSPVVRMNSTRALPRSFPTSTHDAVRLARVCNALDDLAECSVDDLIGAVRDEAALEYLAQGHVKRVRDCNGVPTD